MIDRIIRFSLNNKLIIGLMVLGLIGWGAYSLTELPVDAVPDITNNQVQIISIAPTLAANEVEQFITAPIEVSVVNVPDIIELRSISRLGLSVVTVVFKDNVDIYKARQQISERLKDAESQIPEGLATTDMAPVSTGLGEIYQYMLKVKPGFESKYSLADLRTIQDWIVRREMLGTPGVADVNSYGGLVSQYEVAVNPLQLKNMGLSLNDIFVALENNNQNTGSAYIEKSQNSYFIRGIGLVSSLEDIGKIVVKTTADGKPVLIRDVAKVGMGSAPRYGALVVDTMGEAVGGVVMMLKGSNASKVVETVKERMEVIKNSLPEGVEIVPYLDRTDLVDRAIGTVSRNLLEGGLIVIFVLVLMLGNLRAGLVVASVIPLSMLFAVSMMNVFGISGNLMSLGAIDFGLIVDGAVIIVESVVHRITASKTHHPGITHLNRAQMDVQVYDSSRRMMNSAVFGQIIILVVYLPILALIGIEGKMFRPMAQTVSLAIVGAILLSLTWVPVASTLFIGRSTVKKRRTLADRIMDFMHRIFSPLLNVALKRKISVVIIAVAMLFSGIFLFTRLGGEFIPSLEEGDLASSVMTLQGGSLSNTVETVKKANKILMSNFPEVKHVVCKIGAAEIPTDPTPMETGDYIIVMKDKSEWTSASTREEMMDKMQEALSDLPGVVFELQQPIQMRFNELMTGAKQDVAVKIFGDNLETLAEKGTQVEQMIRNVPGVTDINVEKVTGSGQIQVIYNRDKLAQYGLTISDVNNILKTAFAGNSAGVVYDEEKRFDLVVRLDKPFRQDIQNVNDLYIPLASGKQIPLKEVASVEYRTGVAQVSREDTKRRITVGFNVRNRDVASVVDEVRNKLHDNLKLPAGYYVTYGGQFENLVEAEKRLGIAIPVALLLIFVLLFITFKSVKQSLLILSAVPLSAIGGIVALYLRGLPFSISAGVGFIALFGVAVLNGIVLIAEFNRLEKDEQIADIYERVRKGIHIRLRPVLITALVASLGFLPMAVSVSAGAEVQRPLATVVIGGLISSTLLTLVVLPVLYILFSGRNRKKVRVTPIPAAVILFLLLGLGWTSSVKAQQPEPRYYTLEQAVSRAVEQNGRVRAADLQAQRMKALTGAAWDLGKTSVDLTYGQSNSALRDDNVSVSQGLEFPAVYANRYKLAKAEAKESGLSLTVTKTEVVQEVKIAWNQLVFLKSRLSLIHEQDSVYSWLLNAEALRASTGEGTSFEKISAETQLMQIRASRDQVMADISVMRNRLAFLLNETGPVDVPDTVLKPLAMPQLADSTLGSGSPLLALSGQQVAIRKAESSLERSMLWPDLSVGYFNMSNKELDNQVRFTGFQAGITVPLFFGSKIYSIKGARLNLAAAEAQHNFDKQSLSNELEFAGSECLKLRTSLDFYENYALKQASLLMEQAGKSFREGQISYTDYLKSLGDALGIRSSYLETLSAFNQAVIRVQYLTGSEK